MFIGDEVQAAVNAAAATARLAGLAAGSLIRASQAAWARGSQAHRGGGLTEPITYPAAAERGHRPRCLARQAGCYPALTRRPGKH